MLQFNIIIKFVPKYLIVWCEKRKKRSCKRNSHAATIFKPSRISNFLKIFYFHSTSTVISGIKNKNTTLEADLINKMCDFRLTLITDITNLQKTTKRMAENHSYKPVSTLILETFDFKV